MEEYFEGEIPFTFCWKIENFIMGMLFRKKWLYSSFFTIPYTNTSWRLMVHSNFYFKGEKYISIYLRRTSNKNLRENEDYEIKLSIVSIDDFIHIGRFHSSEKLIDYRGNANNFVFWGSQKFISWNLILKEKEMLLPKDTLTIRCVMKRILFTNLENIYSFLKCFHKLYDKEKRYPPQFKSTSRQAGLECEFGNKTTGLIPSKHYVTPILHKWFEYLSVENFHLCHSITDLRTVIERRILENTHNWPNGVPENCVLHSRLKTENAFFTWYIKEFSRLGQDDKFFSPVFRCGSSDWKLMFYLTEDNGKGIAEIFICPMSLCLNSRKIIKCKISVINRYGRLPLSQESVHTYDGSGHWRFPPFIQTETLNCNKETYLVNDILCLYCTFSMSEGKYECEQSWEILDYNEKFLSQYISLCGLLQMREDMTYLLETGLYTDMIIKVGQIEIPVHKSILSERSSYFKYQIKASSKVKGTKKTTVEILDLEEETVRKLLKFMYSGKHDIPCEVDMLLAFRKYGVDEDELENCFRLRMFRRSLMGKKEVRGQEVKEPPWEEAQWEELLSYFQYC